MSGSKEVVAKTPNEVRREAITMDSKELEFLNNGVAFGSNPISDQIDLTVIISGKVYDLVEIE